jgi:hypothetical protein
LDFGEQLEMSFFDYIFHGIERYTSPTRDRVGLSHQTGIKAEDVNLRT